MLNRILVPIAILVASGAVALVLSRMEEVPEQREIKPPVLLVDTLRTSKRSVRVTVKSQGTVSPRNQTTLVSEVSGLITAVSPSFVAGGFFNKGDELVKIDDRNYLADVKRAEAAVASARTQLAKEAGLAQFAKQDWERLRQQAGSSRMATDLALRKPQLLEALAGLDSAQAELDKKKGDLDRTVIRAPYDGLVKQKIVDVGQFVAAGVQLAVTFAVDYAEVRLPLPDTELSFIDLPDGADLGGGLLPKVTLSAQIGTQTLRWTAQLVRTEGVFDEQSRVLYAVAQIEDPYMRADGPWQQPLRIGTFVTAVIEGRIAEDVVLLPRGSLRPGNRVWIIDEEDTLRSREVSIFRSDEEYVYISSGLNGSELICVTPLENPLPGTRVRYDLPDISAQFTSGPME